MKTRFLLLIVLSMTIIIPIEGQTKADRRDLFNEGEMYILFEEYNEALPSFLDLLKLYPDNAHFKYRIGQCYINIPGEKEKSIPYLEEAVKNINPNHKEGRMSEKGAPYDALYYLANAYRINNQLDKAIETYKLFIQNMDNNIYDSTVVRFQLQTCHNARQLMSTPLYVKKKNMGEDFNNRYSEIAPVVSHDDQILLFSRQEPFRTALLFSNFENGRWSSPVDIIPDLGVDDKYFPTSLSKDGKTLYLYSNFDLDGNIFTSRFANGKWGPVEKLNENINTKYWESHATISPDGKELYFSSNRKGGLGGLDLYVSSLDSLGRWGIARNLGPGINTEYHEDTPFITEDGKTLFFSSRGHYNMGGYDVFYTTIIDSSKWSVPLNAGYPLNTTDDDLFFMPVGNGYEGYMSKFDDKGFGQQDLFRLEIFSDDHPRKFLIRGITRIEDLNTDIAAKIMVTVRDLSDKNSPVIVYADPVTGEFEFEVKHGDYEITFDGAGVVKEVRRLTLPLTQTGDTVSFPPLTFAKIDFEAELTILSDSVIKTITGDTVEIRLLTEPRSTLDVKETHDGKVIGSNRFIINEPTAVYRFVPKTGITIVDFLLTDFFSNTTNARVIIERSLPPAKETITRPEYQRIIATNQVKAFLELLKQEADNDLRKIINGIDVRKQKFGNIDDVISLITEKAVAQNIEPERVEKLALKTSVNQGILTQAVVDYLEKNAKGELETILKGINVYDLKLRTWNDLTEYVNNQSAGRITGVDLRNLADYLLLGQDPAIGIIREKILTYASSVDVSAGLISSVKDADDLKIRNPGEWLKRFTEAAVVNGISSEDISSLYSAITFIPGTKPEGAVDQLSRNSEAGFAEYLSKLDLKKPNIKNLEGFFNKLNIEKGDKFSEDEYFTALAKTIAENNISNELIGKYQADKPRVSKILIPVALLFLIILILLFRKKKKKEEN